MLKRDGYRLLKDRLVGLITNPTGRDRDGNRTVDLLVEAPDETHAEDRGETPGRVVAEGRLANGVSVPFVR